MTAIRKHLGDFVAILGLVFVALVVVIYILGNQRLSLPEGVPFLGKDFYEIEAELSTAQAVTPGQGQTVNVAGVQVGEISSVELEDGRAIVGLKIERGTTPVYNDASVLLRPKTGLKDMVAELTPGTPGAGELDEGGRIPISETLPDVNLDEILAVLDADTRDYVKLLLGDGGRALGDNGPELAATLKRIEPTARYARRVNQKLATRRRNLKRVIHNFSLLMDELGAKDTQLAEFVENSNAVFASLADQDANIRASLQELPSALSATQDALASTNTMATELGPTLESLRPAARALGPSLRQTQPFLRQTTPIIRDELRPFTRAALPTIRELRPALRDLAAASPDLGTAFGVVNALLNTLAYNPPGRDDEGYLFWLSWANHLGATLFMTQDAHGPVRRGLVVFGCQTAQLLDVVAQSNPALGTLVDLLNGPDIADICPQTNLPTAPAPTTPAPTTPAPTTPAPVVP
jgi:phospholipid/cholesterol/gamma-HCH transport system substrate-binding protein